jgi:hypothetical protein
VLGSSNKSDGVSETTEETTHKIELPISISHAASGARCLKAQQKTFHPDESENSWTIKQIH